ncbi:hypothetical protein GGP41_008872 [Bipolaris sorokiniana]|uniref:U3 small nucleolar RNA-associated protein 6 N-terminal domain-containing protein n=1 Tax=Cochliobolus sativus TaxID=45130 RepID=A0A8H6DQX4_COCSA|nr:hypothetical protein GGP41_008872 [Bipolaris sorokiniana]
MAGPSDKARFYLEQSATELNELERKKIFSREEISSIAKKRSDFEHIINARGSHPEDYMRYIEFEKNVDALRRKRIKRLGARYMQRGLRFCKKSEVMWLEYAKLETIYVGKIAGRRRILGLDVDRTKKDEDGDENMIVLPEVTAEDVNPSLKQDDGVDEVALQNLAAAPVLTGAIPLAIFDSAMKQFQGSPRLAERFFGVFAEFEQVACIPRMLQHVLGYLQEQSPQAVETAICKFHLQLYGCDAANAETALRLSKALDVISSTVQQHPRESSRVAEVVVRRLLSLHRLLADVDSSLQKASRAALRKYVRAMEEGQDRGDRVVGLAQLLQQEGRKLDADLLMHMGVKYWGENGEVQKYISAMEG